MKKYIIFCLTLILFPFNVYSYSNKIIPGGNTIGIDVKSKGIMIVGFYKVNGKYNKGTNELREGDYIIKVGDIDVNYSSDLINELNKYKESESAPITFTRNKEVKTTNLKLVKENGKYKTGLYIKDSIIGIGTLSYIDPYTNVYGALGHEIVESNTNKNVEVKDGSIFRSYVTSITRSKNGYPGSKNANFYNKTTYGNVLKNTKYGIYGIYDDEINEEDAIEIKKINEVKKGKAYIRTVVSGEKIKDYEINITSINKSSKLKSITFEIIDEDLLNETGGVVQGMSGSPIIQDGYLIGAVTHVIIDDVKKGYAISIVTMLDEGDKLLN